MAVEKMYFINVAGPLKQIDAFVINNIVPFEVQLVRAFTILDSVKGLLPFEEYNPYDSALKNAEELCKKMNIHIDAIDEGVKEGIEIQEVEEEIHLLNGEIDDLFDRKKSLEKSIVDKQQLARQILPIQNLNIEIDKLFHFEFMRFRFGKMATESYEKMKQFVENLEIIVNEVYSDDEDTYLLYFMPRTITTDIDTLFASLFFQRIWISDQVKGYPKEALILLENQIQEAQLELNEIDQQIHEFIKKNKNIVMRHYGVLSKISNVFNVRQYAMHTAKTFYLTGWIPAYNLDDFVKKAKESELYSYAIAQDEDIKEAKPPTKLKNNKFFKPFEMLIKMYGIPSYNEIDPTIFVAITYIMMFALMFGDLGQGFVIALFGHILYKKTKNPLGRIATYLGMGSMISGLFYGSFFGNEEILRHYLSFIPMFNPMEDKAAILIAAIIFGVALIFLAMFINILNSFKKKRFGHMLFDRNGIVGVVVYFAILFIVLAKVLSIKATIMPAIILIIISFLIIFMSEPLQKLFEGRKKILPEDKAGFFIESFFELFETVLGILSNTISFIRVGAFALNHVGFFMAFNMLSDLVYKSSGKAGSVAVLIIGNILIIGLEGLIVGIQGLRLAYYELFSRFFEGDGIEFKPYMEKKPQNS